MTIAIKTATGPTILLRSGAYFDLLDPEGSAFTIEDIAHGLSMTCRFAGQCIRYYSVAEHCWFASYQVPPHLARAALMHDAAEAFIGDVTRPLKSLLPDYKVIEKRIEAAIWARFDVQGIDDPAIKNADLAMLAAEQGKNMPSHDDSWPILAGIDVPNLKLHHWSPTLARANWLGRYAELSA